MRIAITGGIAEGKSTVLGYCQALGLSCESADVLAKDVFVSPIVKEFLTSEFGHLPERREVLIRVGMDHDFRRKLNRRMHPEILRALQRSNAQVLEVPLLIESCLQGQFSKVWVVTCGPDEQMRRLVDREGDAQAARHLIASQLPTRAKVPFADRVIRTDCPEDTVKSVVREELRLSFPALVH
ncbi:MAG: dephospho-CoA kinase [Armatimonadetes bacterium]|nr:dephospho-CoA kinase [Armatimonadota bacterium]